ncbi:arylacetamide deacetylase-like 4 [Crotalus tigris]|uniref:arylacetamide deacetylase-like 4 n=1 Tax=Crotalus tigris TaxID=88082 RepID=UPI00192F9580|nr:arylacetamide deacetylase-like 4 [Crotalus tigris]
MRSLWKRLGCLLVGTAIYPAIFLVSVIIQYAQTSLPPAIEQQWKLRFCQTVFISGIILGIVLEELGFSSFPEILRIFVNGIPACRDPALVIRDQKFDGVPVRIYSSKTVPATKRKAMVYFHGGCGIFGSYDTYERFLCHVAKEGEATVIAVGYGVGPENPYPNQHAECLKATIFLLKHAEDYGVDSSRVIISGDSFGGLLAAHVCQLLVDRCDLPKVHAQALIYPVLQALDMTLPSYQQNCRSPILWRKLVAFACCRYFNKPTSFVNGLLKNSHVPEATWLKYQKWVDGSLIPEEFKVRGYTPQEPPGANFSPQLYEEMKMMLTAPCLPLCADDGVISKLPRTFLLTCEFDVLRDDGLLYVKRLTDNRVPVTWSHIENGVHGVLVFFDYRLLSFTLANRIARDVSKFIRGL